MDDPNAPELRPPPTWVRLARATRGDLERVTRLYQRGERDRIGEATTRSDDVWQRWMAHGGPGEDTLLVRDDATAELVAYAEFHEDTDPWSDALDLYVEGRVDPLHTGRGLATFLLHRAEDRARRAVARSGAEASVLRIAVVDGDDRARRWHERRGFRPVRHFLQMRLDLTAPPPTPRWPEGVVPRRARLADVPRVWAAHQRAFADLPTALPATLDEWREARIGRDPAFDPDLWLLAQDPDEQILGVCLARGATPEAPEIGDIRDLGVVPDHRRRGIAMSLLRTAFAAFRSRGLTGAALEVDDVTLDGAVALYHAAGLRVARRTDVMELPVVAPAPTDGPEGRPPPAGGGGPRAGRPGPR